MRSCNSHSAFAVEEYTRKSQPTDTTVSRRRSAHRRCRIVAGGHLRVWVDSESDIIDEHPQTWSRKDRTVLRPTTAHRQTHQRTRTFSCRRLLCATDYDRCPWPHFWSLVAPAAQRTIARPAGPLAANGSLPAIAHATNSVITAATAALSRTTLSIRSTTSFLRRCRGASFPVCSFTVLR